MSKQIKRAKDAVLGELHIALAEDLLRKVQSGEATASELQAAIKFLQNNNISATPEQNPALEGLRKVALPDFSEEAEYED